MAFGTSLRRRVEQLSFRNKMGLATIFACALCVATACVAFTLHELTTYRDGFEQEQHGLAEVLASNVTAAVLFGDETMASDLLGAIRLVPQIDAAYILADGRLFAYYESAAALPKDPQLLKSFTEGYPGPTLKVPVISDGEHIGELFLLTNNDELKGTISSYLTIATLVFLGACLMAMTLAHWEARAIYSPILRLRTIIQSIRETRDYSARVETVPDKDFGRLIDSFNAMLAEIENRDERLERVVGDLVMARDAADTANKSKSQFLANMSHELRTPLNAIINYAEIIIEDLEDVKGDEASTESLETASSDLAKIKSAGIHLLTLINGILDLSKIEAGRMEIDAYAFDLKMTLREVADTVRPAAEQNGNQLVMRVDDHVGTIVTDGMKLKQCILNLLSNACKFTKDGTVSTEIRSISVKDVPSVEIVVADTGIGMDAHQIESLFEAFVQADASTTRQYGGTGLGLAITKRMVELLGGTIRVESELGTGSRFIIIVPCQHPAAENIEVEDVSADIEHTFPGTLPEAQGTERQIALIVDDDAAARDLMARIVLRLNYEVRFAKDGEQALAMIAEEDPAVIVLDLHMPRMNGWTLLQHLKRHEEYADIPVIVVSVDEDRAACLKLGAEDYFTKPLNRLELERALMSYAGTIDGRVLIVEDNENAVDLLSRAASQLGFGVEVARSAEAGLTLLSKEPYQGIILDLGLPGMNGFEFLSVLRETPDLREIPVIVFSAQELDDDQLSTLSTNAQGYFQKGNVSPRAVLRNLVKKSNSRHGPEDQEEVNSAC